MGAEDFYGQVIENFNRPPMERHTPLTGLHDRVLRDYITAVQSIAEDQAYQRVNIGSDLRTLGEVVAHIAAWERFGIIAAEDVLAGLDHPRSVTDMSVLAAF